MARTAVGSSMLATIRSVPPQWSHVLTSRLKTRLGEMRTLATGVDDLKRVLGNVRTRGVLGQAQLPADVEAALMGGDADADTEDERDDGP